MDDDLQDFEAELKALQPAPPSRELEARLERELAVPAKRRPLAPIRWIWSVALPAAAAIALMSTQGGRPPGFPGSAARAPGHHSAQAAAETSLKPVAAENVLVSTSDEGLVTLEDGTPARRERLQFVDTITWRNPRSHASLTWSVPREEVRVVPISFQ